MKLLFITFLFSVITNAQSLNSLYNKNTLILNVSADEIKKNPIWKKHGEVYDSFFGVEAYSNKNDGEYQCTELLHRFLRQIYQVPTKLGMGLGHANVVLKNIYDTFGADDYIFEDRPVKLKFLENYKSAEPPSIGSVINFQSGKFGHVAVVRYVKYISASEVNIYLLEQHGFPTWKDGEPHPIRSLKIKKNKNNFWGGEFAEDIGKPISWINLTLI